MHNLCILVGFIDSGAVKTIRYDAAVGIAVTKFHRVRICSVGHDALSKMLIEGRKGREIFGLSY